MFATSIPSLKRQCTETATDFIPKKSKLEELNVDRNQLNDHGRNELQLEQSGAKNDASKANKKTELVSLILNGQKKHVQIFPGQIVWCRFAKSPFWPSMVWSTKSGKITDESKLHYPNVRIPFLRLSFSDQRVIVKLFARKDANVWMKLENIFPFDGLESFEKMKSSVDVRLMTVRILLRNFEIASR